MSKASDNWQKEIVAKLITAIEESQRTGESWTKGWNFSHGLPRNVETGVKYRGSNIINLAMLGFSDPRFGTYKTWQRMGVSLKGIKSVGYILKPKTFVRKDIDAFTGEEVTSTGVAGFNAEAVWNAEQFYAQGFEPLPETEKTNFTSLNHVESYVAQTGATIQHGGGKAFFSPATDYIQMPHKADFTGTKTSTPEEYYYATLLHELTHWTGHKSRLDRTKGRKFGDKDYAFEELVAELGAVFLSATLGIVTDQPRADHAHYLKSWLTALKGGHEDFINKAATDAFKAVEFLDGLQDAETEKAA